MTHLLPNTSKSTDFSPNSSPRTSPRIKPHRASISNTLQARVVRHAGRSTEASPDIPGADSAYGGSLADLDLGPSEAVIRSSKAIRSMPTLARDGSSTSLTTFYEQVRGWYDNEIDRLQGGMDGTTSLGQPIPGLGLDSLKQLGMILDGVALERPSCARRRSSKSLKNNRQLSYGTNLEDFYTTDNEKTILQDVPSCEATLDNSEELSIEFKGEVLRLTHTLKIKNWRKLDLDKPDGLQVKRISGALTNAVYKVTPPVISQEQASKPVDTPYMRCVDQEKRPPKQPKPLLLRIYGPQVGHLIDRDTELNILRRLAKQKVGPTLLGTFDNGRFEEFFDARTLTREDIRLPDTSRRIGRRLRDLHGFIPLMESERRNGPVLWRNWEKWVTRGEAVMKELQKQKGKGKRLLVTKWEVLREVIETRYRPWLEKKYGGAEEIKKAIVFCHNDTQYGNIMSRESETEPPTPTSKSPLLAPVQAKKPQQSLIVIDFEYAGANTRGCEFANHFCEWMSDYLAELGPVAHNIHADKFPTPEEQRNIIRAYVEHRSLPYVIPTEDAMDPDYRRKKESMFFNLDRLPTREEMELMDREVERLVEEAQDWRPAVNACWALWGVVQATIPGLVISEGGEVTEATDATAEEESPAGDFSPPVSDGEDEPEFDYVKYAEQKSMVLWADLITLGVVTEEELKKWSGREDVRSRLKWLNA